MCEIAVVALLVAASSPAWAQKAVAGLDQRIDAVFDIVPDNRVELAVPLTKRALARRAMEEDNLPLPFLGETGRAAAAEAIGQAITPRRVATVPIFEPQSPPAADPAQPSEGDADDETDEIDLPRVPTAHPQMDLPTELVAGAAAAPVKAAASPQRAPQVAAFAVDTSEPMVTVAAEAAPEPVKPVQIALPQAEEPQQPLQLPLAPAAPTKVVAQAPPPAADPGPTTLVELQPALVARAAVLPLPEAPRNLQPSAAPAAAQPLTQAPPAAAEPQAAIEAPRRPEPAQTATAPDACLAPSQVTDADGDFRRNADALAGEGLCITEQKFKERRRPWDIQTVSSGRPGPLWVVVHDDEDLSFDTAVQALKAYGGTLVAMETRGKRNQDGIDPNRNFSDAELSCDKLGESAAPKFTAAWRAKLDGFRPIIALHNNFDGPVPTTGIGHVAMDTVPRGWPKARSKDPNSPLAGKFDLVLLAGTDSSEPHLRSWMSELSGQGVNVVVEPIRSERGDCSLSNYAVLTGHPDYFNVTVDHGEGEKQRKIIDAIVTGFSTVSAAR